MPEVVRSVDHLTVLVDEMDLLYDTLSTTFGLPVVWPRVRTRQDDYDSEGAGFSVGNIVLELIHYRSWGARWELAHRETTALYKGLVASGPPYRVGAIALDPFPLAEAVPELERRGIAFRAPVPSEWVTTVRLPMVARGIDVFLCQFTDRAGTSADRHRVLRKALDDVGGGPLGIAGVAEVIVGMSDPAEVETWQALFGRGPAGVSASWEFGHGPRLRLVDHSADEVVGLTLSVRSLPAAVEHLRNAGALGATGTDWAIVQNDLLEFEVRLVAL